MEYRVIVQHSRSVYWRRVADVTGNAKLVADAMRATADQIDPPKDKEKENDRT